MIDHPYLNKLRPKKIHLVGLASAEISAVAEFLHTQGCDNLVAHDIHDGVDFKKAYRRSHQSMSRIQQVQGLKKLDALPIKKNLGKEYLKDIDQADVIFPTQGWFLYKKSLDQLQSLLDQGVGFSNIMKLYLQLAPATVIGVTGTNGKGTTTHLIRAMLAAGKKKVYLAGNDPKSVQVLDKLEEMKADDYLVLEISNRQLLLDLGASPHLAVITNVTPNHLDEHHNIFAEYAEVKRALLKYQEPDDVAVLNFDDETCVSFQEKSEAKIFGFSVFKKVAEGAMVLRDDIVYASDFDNEIIAQVTDVKLPGQYNQENILAAVVVARQCDIPKSAIKIAISEFKGLPQRLEFVREIDQVRYYNDLYSTTSISTQRAIESFSEPVILIAGGDAKGVDYFNLAESIKKHVKKLWLFPGTVSDDLKKDFASVHFSDFVETDDFKGCLTSIKKDAQAGDIVLLSPGGAYFRSEFIEKKSLGFNSIIKSW